MSKGSSPPALTATFNPARGVWETPQVNMLCGHSAPYSRTWPASGSMRNGSVSGPPTSEPPTSAPGSSSSPGLPTPRARDCRGRGFQDGLPNVVQLLPTPTVSEATGTGHAARGGMNLRHTISLLPTPTRADSHDTASFRPDGTPYGAGYGQTLVDAARLLPTPVRADGERQSTAYGRGNPTLAGALLPTPRASANENRQTRRTPSQEAGTHDLCLAAEVASLLPTPSAAHRIGAPTPKPSRGGRRSAGGSLPGQLTIEDA